MILSKSNLSKINTPGLALPAEEMLELPEKVLQFGTGVLLRGLPDYYIDKANRQGLFNGRVVVVKSTDTGSAAEFDRQDSLYTLHLKGIDNGKEVNEQMICSAISRVLTAGTDWGKILEVAKSPDLKVVISNTTEVGIQLVQDDIRKYPPVSFPGKLLAVLYERYKAFNGSKGSGLVIVPTELIVDNGKKLESIVLELAHLNKLEPAFVDWLKENNHFCNSLVDRIVPGAPNPALADEMNAESGYQDSLRIIAEVYSLWAIEGDEHIKEVLSFASADKGVLIVPDIEMFRELKLRLLNGTHTISCGIAYLSGFRTVKEAMDNADFAKLVTQLMIDEVLPALPYNIDVDTATDFANRVLDRFRNPFVEHQWISISAQYSSKMKMRVVPIIINYYKTQRQPPKYLSMGFAAFLRFLKSEKQPDGKFLGNYNSRDYVITDSQAEIFSNAWNNYSNIHEMVNALLGQKELWGFDLNHLPGFRNAVLNELLKITGQ
jgi:tagaturonate reductase